MDLVVYWMRCAVNGVGEADANMHWWCRCCILLRRHQWSSVVQVAFNPPQAQRGAAGSFHGPMNEPMAGSQ